MKSFYKIFFITFVSLLLAVISFIMLVNYFIDPANQFFYSRTYETKIANLLLNKNDIIINNNFNDRFLQKTMLERLPVQPEILILGSSHTMPLSQMSFKFAPVYNASVTGSTLEDDISLYYVYQKRGWQPKILIICMDPWLVNKNFLRLFNGYTGRQWQAVFFDEFNSAKKLLSRESKTNLLIKERLEFSFEKYSQLLTIDYLKATLKQLRQKGDISHEINTVFNNPDSTGYSIKHSDGSQTPSKDEEATLAKDADLAGRDLVHHTAAFYRNVPNLDAKAMDTFEKFIKYLLNQHVQIIFYFPALEPKAYAELIENNPSYTTLKVVDRYYRGLAEKYNITMISAYDPKMLNLHADDFTDGWHIKQKAADKIFTSYNINHNIS